MNEHKLELVSRKNINTDKWDHTIQNSFSPSLYGKSWYLDAVTNKKWAALVMNDYEAIMPVYIKKKWALRYVTQPFLCQHLGVFTSEKTFALHYNEIFMKYLKDHFMYVNFSQVPPPPLHVKYVKKTNHFLLLNKHYDEIFSKYNRNTRRNILAAYSSGLEIFEGIDDDVFLDFMCAHDPTGLIIKHREKIKEIITATGLTGNGYFIGASDSRGIRGLSYYIVENDRAYFLLCASDSAGKEKKAMYAIIDEAIKKFQHNCSRFDFTGSSIDSIARRNEGFGAEKENYYNIILTRIMK